MAITEAPTVPATPLKAEPAPRVGLSTPIPSWNTPEYPAEWPRSDELSTVPRHVAILNYLLNALFHLLEQRGRPFGVNQDIGIHFIDANGQPQRCDPDMIVMPFPNTGRGSLRRWDMPCPPDCVIEVASPSTVNKDLGLKKDWYAGMGIREYWILDPIDSDDPAHFKTGLLLSDSPLMGWRLVQGRYEPLRTYWDADARSWSAYSPVLDCGLLLLEELHREEIDGGYRIVDPETGQPLASTKEKNAQLAEKNDQLAEKNAQLAEKNAQLAEKEKAIREAVTVLARLQYGTSVSDQLRLMMQRTSTPTPTIDVVQGWMSATSSEEFLDLARRYFGWSG